MQSPRTLFFILAIISLITIRPFVGSWNDASRMAATQSLVEKHTLVIDESVFVETGDKVFINGHFYSDKPLIPSILAAAAYLPLYHLGIELDLGWNLAYYLITLFTVKSFWLAGLYAFYLSLQYCNLNITHRLCLTFSLAVASLHLTWSSTFNNHSLAASQLAIGFYFYLKSKNNKFDYKTLFLSGFFFSLASVCDIPTAVFYIAFLVLIFINVKSLKWLYPFIIPLLVTAIPALFINYSISGSILPVQINAEYFNYPGSPWIGSDELSGVKTNDFDFIVYYSITMLIGKYRGFIIHNPLLILAIPIFIYEIINRRIFIKEAIGIFFSCLIIFLYYIGSTNNYSGWNYSIRWFIPFLPFLFFFLYPFFQNLTLPRKFLFIILFTSSVIISCIGFTDPWSPTPLYDFLYNGRDITTGWTPN